MAVATKVKISFKLVIGLRSKYRGPSGDEDKNGKSTWPTNFL